MIINNDDQDSTDLDKTLAFISTFPEALSSAVYVIGAADGRFDQVMGIVQSLFTLYAFS